MNAPLLIPVLIALGAIPGALIRYFITLFCTQKLNSNFPYGTFIVNGSGALLIGVFAAFFERINAPSSLSSLILAGFLGSYTTFSTYALDTSKLLRIKEYITATLYWFGSFLLGLLCVELGLFIGQRL